MHLYSTILLEIFPDKKVYQVQEEMHLKLRLLNYIFKNRNKILFFKIGMNQLIMSDHFKSV